MRMIKHMMTEDELGEREATAQPAARPSTVMERLARMLAESEEPTRRTRLRDALLNGDFSVLFEADGSRRSAED
jgi:hypothetical protein